MKQITISHPKIVWEDRVFKITNVVHEIPTWCFPAIINRTENQCPVCRQEMRKIIGHGKVIETCSIIEYLAHAIPIHTECYKNLPIELP